MPDLYPLDTDIRDWLTNFKDPQGDFSPSQELFYEDWLMDSLEPLYNFTDQLVVVVDNGRVVDPCATPSSYRFDEKRIFKRRVVPKHLAVFL